MGILGGGGSIIAVPALTFLLHLPPKDAVVTSLAVVGLAATAGAIGGLLRGVVPIAVALTVGVPATLGAYLGAMAGARISDRRPIGDPRRGDVRWRRLLLWREQRRHCGARRTRLAWSAGGAGVIDWRADRPGRRGRRIPDRPGAGDRRRAADAASGGGVAVRDRARRVLRHWPATWVTSRWRGRSSCRLPRSRPRHAGRRDIALRLPQRRLQQAFAVSLVVLGSYVLVQL